MALFNIDLFVFKLQIRGIEKSTEFYYLFPLYLERIYRE